VRAHRAGLPGFYHQQRGETNDPAYIAHCLGIVARARGLPGMARQTHLFSATGNPTLRTVLALLDSLGLRLAAKPASEA